MHKKFFILSLFTILLFYVVSYACADEIVLGTTQELKPIAENLKDSYLKDNNDTEFLFVIGSENELIDLVKEPESTIDILFLDNNNIINQLAKNNLLNKDSIKVLGKDTLCIIVKKNVAMRAFMLYPKTLASKSIAIGNPGLCSLGIYTKEALKNYNLWEKFGHKLAFFQDNNTVISFVKRGQYDGGICYCSFARRSFIHITDYINPSLHTPILYTTAINATREETSPVYSFNRFLSSQKAKDVLKKYTILSK